MGLGAGERAHQKKAVIETFCGLMIIEGCEIEVLLPEVKFGAVNKFLSGPEPIFIVFPRLLQRLLGRQRLRLYKGIIRLFEQHNPIAQDVHEEVAAEPQLLVHIVEAVINEADRRTQCGAGRKIGKQLRSEEHTSVHQSLMRISYAVYSLKQN